jgi:hypothetical protein
MGSYTEAELEAAAVKDAIDRLALQQADLVHGRAWRPVYGDLEPYRAYEPVPVTAADITLSDVDDAVSDLAVQFGLSYADMYEQVRLAADGERDTVSLANAVVDLATGKAAVKKTGDVDDEEDDEDEKEEEEEEEEEEEPRQKKARRKRRKVTSPDLRGPSTGGGWGSPTEAPGPGGRMESGSVAAARRWARVSGPVSLSAGD